MKLQSILRLFEHNLEFIVMSTRFLDAKLLYSAMAVVWLLNLDFDFDGSLVILTDHPSIENDIADDDILGTYILEILNSHC